MYSNLHVRIEHDTQSTIVVNVSFDVANHGSTYNGKEIIQCYIHDCETSIYRPYHELKYFTKTKLLHPTETCTIQFQLTKDAFSFYDIGVQDWIVECGTFVIQIGSNCEQIQLEQQITLQVDHVVASSLARESYPSIPQPTIQHPTLQPVVVEQEQHVQQLVTSAALEIEPLILEGGQLVGIVDDITFAKRFGLKWESVLEDIQQLRLQQQQGSQKRRKLLIHRNTLLKDINTKWNILGRVFFMFIYRISLHDSYSNEIQLTKSQRQRHERVVRATVEHVPLRALVLFSKGQLTFHVLDVLIHTMNLHIGSAIVSACSSLMKGVMTMVRRR